jgi:hypothetical protein
LWPAWLIQGIDQRGDVLLQLLIEEARPMVLDDAGLVGAVLHLAALAFFTAVATSIVTVPTRVA